MRLELFETRLAHSPGSDIWSVHQSTFNKYFLGHFINDGVSGDASFPEIGVKQERRHDDRADRRDQDRSGSCNVLTGTCFLSRKLSHLLRAGEAGIWQDP